DKPRGTRANNLSFPPKATESLLRIHGMGTRKKEREYSIMTCFAIYIHVVGYHGHQTPAVEQEQLSLLAFCTAALPASIAKRPHRYMYDRKLSTLAGVGRGPKTIHRLNPHPLCSNLLQPSTPSQEARLSGTQDL
ncbi:hypothetical protein ACLOJK_021545, partial [Asimina triloba]